MGNEMKLIVNGPTGYMVRNSQPGCCGRCGPEEAARKTAKRAAPKKAVRQAARQAAAPKGPGEPLPVPGATPYPTRNAAPAVKADNEPLGLPEYRWEERR